MTLYRLHTSPSGGCIPFTTFILFFRAMQASSAIVLSSEHYSSVTFRFADKTQTEYRLHCEPLHTWQQIHTPVEVLSCPQRPGSYVLAYVGARDDRSVRQTPIRTTRVNIFATVEETELAEVWTYTVLGRKYILSKVATAATKELASQAGPVFGIAIESTDRRCVHDLLGRFTDGCADQLQVSSQVYE